MPHPGRKSRLHKHPGGPCKWWETPRQSEGRPPLLSIFSLSSVSFPLSIRGTENGLQRPPLSSCPVRLAVQRTFQPVLRQFRTPARTFRNLDFTVYHRQFFREHFLSPFVFFHAMLQRDPWLFYGSVQ